MPATIYPPNLGYSWGITETETGMSMSSYRQNDTSDKFEQKNGQGEVVAIVGYNQRSEITMEGEIFTAFNIKAGTAIVIANIILPPAGVAGLVFCHSVEYQDSREAMRKVTVSATMYPLIPAA